jgi:hypothetical protein
MLRRILLALLLLLHVLPHGARAQTVTYTYETSVEGSGYEDMAAGESRDVPCEYSFAPTFYSYYGVEFEGQMFSSEWRSKRSDFPLPAWNWYYAYPARTVVSNNGDYRWENAEIQVHCWVYRSLYGITIHRDHVASLGRLVELCEGEWDDRERIEIQGHDDGVTAPTSALSTTCGGDEGGGGGGGGGGSMWRCYTVIIDHYWYYPDTGRIEYRYTEEHTYCEQLA